MNQKPVIQIGKPTHFGDKYKSACGIHYPTYVSNDVSQINCVSCLKTSRFKSVRTKKQS